MDLNSGAPFVRHFLIRRPFPAHAGHCGGPHRALLQLRPLHLSPLHCPPREGVDSRTTSPGVQRVHPASRRRFDFWETESALHSACFQEVYLST